MCQIEYKKFEICNHWVIECHEPCSEVLFKAALTENLQICMPSVIDTSEEYGDESAGPLTFAESPRPVTFIGFTGFCNLCVQTFGLPFEIYERSYSDKTLQCQFMPEDLYLYLSTQTIKATVPYLLGIDDQLARIDDQGNADAFSTALGPTIVFHGGNRAVTLAQLRRMQHRGYIGGPNGIQGKWSGVEGPMSSAAVLDSIACPKGFTGADLCAIDDALETGKERARELYHEAFEMRGMTATYYAAFIRESRDIDIEFTETNAESAKEASEPPTGKVTRTPEPTDAPQAQKTPSDKQKVFKKIPGDPFVSPRVFGDDEPEESSQPCLTPGAAARLRAWDSTSEEEFESSPDESAPPQARFAPKADFEDWEPSEDESASTKAKPAPEAKPSLQPESSLAPELYRSGAPSPERGSSPPQQSSGTQSSGLRDCPHHAATRGFKRTFSTMHKDDAQDSGHSGNSQRPPPGQTLSGSPIKRGRHAVKRRRALSPGQTSTARPPGG